MIGGVLTASELALLRTRPQRTLLYLAIPEYKTIYTARENGTPATNDNIVSVTFDGGIGTLTDVEPGMTLLVGTSTGNWDVGIARIRAAPIDDGGGTGHLLIGITSEIDWADDLYYTVIDDIGLWPKHPYLNAAGTLYMDYDIAYTNQNQAGAPIPIMGTHAVVELTGASVSVDFDASGSYNGIGAPTSYDYAWYVDGVLAANTAAVTLNFTAVGTYLIKLEITSNFSFCTAGQEAVAYRYVIVHDCQHPLNSSFVLDSCSGSWSEGGWSYRVTMNSNATQADVRDRTLCLLVAEDWYGDTKDSIGLLSGRENIVCVGWVDGESIRRSNDKGMVSFDIQGPHFWLGVQEGFPTGIDDTNAAPTDWSHIQALDPQKGLFSFLHWRTTATMVMDCWITDDDHRLATTYTPAGNLYEQLRAIAERVNAYTVCDRYGRLFCQIDTQFLTPAFRTFPVVQTLNDRDWRDEITIERRTISDASQIDLSGIYYSGDLATSSAIFALSPGHYPKHYGTKRQIQRIALDDQAEANTIAGLWAGYFNNEYPNIDVPFSSNYRAVDIAPRMFVQMYLLAGDTPRGIEWQLSFVTAPKKLIPREVSFNYDTRQALLLTDITFEAETYASDAVTGDPPIEPPEPPHVEPPSYCDDPAALNYGLEGDCVYAEPIDAVFIYSASQLGRSLDFYTAASPAWTNIKTSGLAGANVGHILNFAVSSIGDAWALTYNDEATLDDNGVFYCGDVFATTPTWTLICSLTAYRALGYTSYPQALGVDSNNIFYCQTSDQAYGYGSGGVIAFRASTNPPPNRVCINGQYSIGAGAVATQVRGTHSPTAIPGKAIITMAGAVDTLVCYHTTLGAPPWFNAVSNNHFMVTAGVTGDVYHYTDNAVLNASVLTLIYSGSVITTGMCSDGANVLSVRAADDNLMIGAVALAVPATVFGVGMASGGFCFGLAGYGEVIWVSRTGAVAGSFIAIRDTGGTWTNKTGNWIATFGSWEGTHANITPQPSTVEIA